MFEIILIIIAIVVLWRVFRSYRLNTFDTVVAFTGGLGAGKSFLSTEIACRLLRRKRAQVWWHNLGKKKTDRKPKPLLYSSIPVKVSRKENAIILTEEHLTLQKKLVEGSVIFIDEIGSFCSQFDYKAVNTDVFDEFVRFYRHYTKGGYFVCNDQCSENIVLQVRRRINTVYNLMGFRKWFGLFYTVKVRNISVSEEIKTVEEQDTEDNMTTLFGFMPLLKRYDTYCYSDRYNYVEKREESKYNTMKKMDILRLPRQKVLSIDERRTIEERKKVVEIETKIAEAQKGLLTENR